MPRTDRMFPTVVERARKRSFEGVKKRKSSETYFEAMTGNDILLSSKVSAAQSVTLEEGYHVDGEEGEMESGGETMNAEVNQELLEENQFGSS